jgi:predicted oxidoreductase
MRINVIERKGSDYNYVQIFTHHIGRIGAPSRRTVFMRANTKQLEVPKIVGRNTNANIFQKRSAGFKATTDLNNKKCIKVVSPFT